MADTLVLVVPGMLALASHDLAAMRSLSTLAHFAGAPQLEARGIAAAIFASLGVDSQTPVAPLALLGAGGDPRDAYVLRADPVHLAADRDRIALVQTIDDLSTDEANVLVQMLDRHFAADDLRFEAVRPDAWFARRSQPANIVTTPPDAARGRNLFASMPSGADGGLWKRWQNEIEMLMHDHPVNVAREARGAPAVSGIWFSGGGRMTDVRSLPPAIVGAAPMSGLGDLARGIATHAGTTRGMNDDFEQLMAREADASRGALRLAVLEHAGDLDAKWLAPALERLAAQRLGALHLIADGNGTAATWTARAPRFWRRWFARASHRRFEIPAPADE
ncbi:MAG TPA: hypothetical protein VF304_07130 [Casimicrobiaceae bacterium]